MILTVYLEKFIYYKKVYLALQTGKTTPLQETFRTFLIKIKIIRGSQEALLMKRGVSIDKINQNRRKMPVKKLIF